MKFTPEVQAALETLYQNAENDFERHRLDVLVRDLTAPSVVEQVDDSHQKFVGLNFRLTKDGHFVSGNQPIHRAIWLYYNGEIPEGYVIHHVDENPANNDISNLQCLTSGEHNRIHNQKGRGTRLKRTIFTCQHCGKQFEAFSAGVNRYCSPRCRNAHGKQQARDITKTCLWCGKEFKANYPEAKFCSYSCSNKATHQKRSNKQNCICPICGKEFQTTPSQNHKTCSKECGYKLRIRTLKVQLKTPLS